MISSALILRFIVSFAVLIALIVIFALFLKLLKSKGYNLSNTNKNSKQLRLLEQFYIDSKNKIIKIQDGKKVLTILIGANAKLINQEESDNQETVLKQIQENKEEK